MPKAVFINYLCYMSLKFSAPMLLAFCGLVHAAGHGNFEDVITPKPFAAESFLKDSAEYESPLNVKGSDWLLAANFFAGGGAVLSESMADTANPRGYLGARLHGYKDSLDFDLNLLFDNFDNKNLKRYKDLQFTGHIGFRHDWIQVKAGRGAEHLGPGIYNNLTFNRSAYAYDKLSINLDLGPLHVYSFYGSLRVAPWSVSKKLFDDRDVYGHRYELALQNFTFGISEITTLYDNNQPWLFVPTVPLFMEKGNFSENSNNGAIAFDVEYRLWGFLRMYSEFLLDDMESPIRLVANDNAESKWGWMAGMQVDGRLDLLGRNIGVGSIVEYARIEPYVYTHFIENTAQMAHVGKPLGNPNGPNSQVVDWSVYFSYNHHLTAVLHNKWLWKGTDYGSQLNDETRNALHTKKKFLSGAKMQYSLAPLFIYSLDHVSYQVGFRFFNEQDAYANVVVWW